MKRPNFIQILSVISFLIVFFVSSIGIYVNFFCDNYRVIVFIFFFMYSGFMIVIGCTDMFNRVVNEKEAKKFFIFLSMMSFLFSILFAIIVMRKIYQV